MSYGAPPALPAKPAADKPAATKPAGTQAAKKAGSPRVRKGGTLQEKAEALFDPAQATAKSGPDQD